MSQPHDTPFPLLNLPPELILTIAQTLPPSPLSRLHQTNHTLHTLLTLLLLTHALTHTTHNRPIPFWALETHHSRLLTALLDRGFPINHPITPYPRATTLLSHAVESPTAHRHVETIRLLLSRGASIHAAFWQHIPWAAYPYHCTFPGSLEILEMLLEYGLDVNARTRSGATMLHAAVRQRRRECVVVSSWEEFTEHWEERMRVVRVLVERGVDVQAVDRWGHGDTAVLGMWKGGAGGDLRLVKYLKSVGARTVVGKETLEEFDLAGMVEAAGEREGCREYWEEFYRLWEIEQ